jgi:hypothetical protein
VCLKGAVLIIHPWLPGILGRVFVAEDIVGANVWSPP